MSSCSSVTFTAIPDALEDVPEGHLLIMKDVLQHLPIKEVRRFIDVVFPRHHFCLITNSHRKVARDGSMVHTEVLPGDFRCLDLRDASFHLPGAYVLRFYTGAAEELRTLLVQRAWAQAATIMRSPAASITRNRTCGHEGREELVEDSN